jgi:integrase
VTRTALGTYGRYGATVNVYAMTLNGEPVARAEWRELGQRKTKTFRGPKRDREQMARAFAEGTADRLKGGEVAAPKRLTVGELWTLYLTAQAPDWRPKTLALAKARWRVFVDHVNPLTFADLVRPETLDSWRKVLLETATDKTKQPMARNQVAHHIQLVKSVWRFGKQRKLLSDNVLADYEVRKGRDYGALEVPEFSPADWGKILRQFSYRDARQWRPWAAIALDGMLAPRSNALLKLRWTDVDMTRRAIRWPGDTDKVGRTREQPLPRDAVKVLRICRVWARRQEYTGEYVFYGVQVRTRGTHWTYSALNAQLNDACTDAGVKRVKYQGMHSLRRMAGGNVLAATGDITKVGDWLGDTDVRVLRKSYLRQRPEHLATIAAGTALPLADKSGNQTATAPTRGAAGQTTKR